MSGGKFGYEADKGKEDVIEKGGMKEFCDMLDALMISDDEERSELSLFHDAEKSMHDYLQNIHSKNVAELAAKAVVDLSRFYFACDSIENEFVHDNLSEIIIAIFKGEIDREEMKRYIIEYGALKKKGKS